MKRVLSLTMVAMMALAVAGCHCTSKAGKCCGTCKKAQVTKCTKCPDAAQCKCPKKACTKCPAGQCKCK